MQSKRYVIWDWNGTLFNDASCAHSILNQMQRSRKMKETGFDDYQRIYEHPIELIYQRAGFDFEIESYDVLAHEWHEAYLKQLPHVELHADSIVTLNHFRSRNLEQVVLSALPHDILVNAIKGNGVTEYFLHIHGLADRAGRSKIENGHALMKKWQAQPNETVLIGDSTHDFETAQALGVECILVARGFEHREKLERHGVRVLEDFTQLRDG
jgi:phosphoglycolate phosphatase